MNYAVAKAAKLQLESELDAASKALHSIPGIGSGNMGLTPDHIKSSPEYKQARAAYDNAFESLRRFNASFMKTFKKEYTADLRSGR